MDAFCTKCGQRIGASDEFCPACGVQRFPSKARVPEKLASTAGTSTSTEGSSASAPARPTHADPASLQAPVKEPIQWFCPNCGGNNIQKVSVIHAAGTSSSSRFFGALGGISTELAAQVAPPREPTQPKAPPDPNSLPSGCLLAFVVLIFFPITWIFGAGIIFVAKSLGGGAAGSDPSSSDWVWGLLIAFGLTALFVRRANRHSQVDYQRDLAKHRDNMAEYRDNMAEYQTHLAEYNERRAMWERSFFCLRCGSTFELAGR